MSEKQMMKGNEAIAEAVVRAGLDLYAGYPITPQTEVLEYLSYRLPEVGKDFIQAEDEISAINMVFGAASTGIKVMTSSCGPGISLKQEGMSYIANSRFPAVILNVQRWGTGLGGLDSCQVDYKRETRGGGHGDYRSIVLAPASVQEQVDIAYEAFDIAFEWRNPVVILSEAALGQMMEPCIMPEFKQPQRRPNWARNGHNGNPGGSPIMALTNEEKEAISHVPFGRAKAAAAKAMLQERMKEELQRWEEVQTEDAEYIMVAFGLPSRVAKDALRKLRAEGHKVGLIRPITLWPFPFKAFEKLTGVKGFMSVESNDTGQMIEDVALAAKKARIDAPVYLSNAVMEIPSVESVIENYKKMINSELKEVF